jgi:ankyrin repeat protein
MDSYTVESQKAQSSIEVQFQYLKPLIRAGLSHIEAMALDGFFKKRRWADDEGCPCDSDPLFVKECPLATALILGKRKKVLELLERGASPHGSKTYGLSGDGRSRLLPLTVAVRLNQVWAIDLLIQRGANPDGCSYESGGFSSVLNDAVWQGHMESTARLLKYGADPTKAASYDYAWEAFYSSFFCAFYHGNEDLLQLLFKHCSQSERGRAWLLRTLGATTLPNGVLGSDPDDRPTQSASDGAARCLGLLLENPAINQELVCWHGLDGGTILHHLAAHKLTHLAESAICFNERLHEDIILVLRGCDPFDIHAKDANGATARDIALKHGALDIARILSIAEKRDPW